MNSESPTNPLPASKPKRNSSSTKASVSLQVGLVIALIFFLFETLSLGPGLPRKYPVPPADSSPAGSAVVAPSAIMTEPEKAVKIVKTESTSPAGFGLRKSVKDPRIEIKEYLRRKSIISKGIPSDRVGPSINGLFLGMKWEDAFQWIDTHVMEKCEFRGLDSGVLAGSVFIKFESPSMESRSSDPAEEKRGNYLCIDPDSGLLTDFSFCGTTLDRIFRSESMTSKEFASWYSRKFGTEAFIPDEDTPGMFMLNNQLTKTFICASSTFNPNFKILCSGIVR